MNTISKIDSQKKSGLLAKAFSAHVLELINKKEFYDLIEVIEMFKLHYVEEFIEFIFTMENYQHENIEYTEYFYRCGIVTNKTKSRDLFIYRSDEPKYSDYRLTNVGRLFVEHVIIENKSDFKKRLINKIMNISVRQNDVGVSTLVKELSDNEFAIFLESQSLNAILAFDLAFERIHSIIDKDFSFIIKTELGKYKFYINV